MITKADVANFRICERRAFFFRNRPELAKTLSKSELARFAQGREIGQLAREQFVGCLISTPSTDLALAADETASALKNGDTTLFEATFVYGNLVARADILRRDGPSSWEIIEVKSTLSVKPEHVLDAAFQTLVLSHCNLPVTKVSLMHLNSHYSTGDELSSLFTIVDISDKVFEAIESIRQDIAAVGAVLASTLIPDVIPNTHCKATSCAFIDHCFSGLPEYDVSTFPRVATTNVAQWHSEGRRDLREVPPATLTPRQRLIQSVVQTGEPFIDAHLWQELEKYRSPIAFVDFEAEGSPVPLFERLRPYSPVPFQWSMHVIEKPDSFPVHKQFLHTDLSDPRPQFSNALLKELVGVKTIVTYSAYEKTRVKALADEGVPGGEDLVTLFNESVDLMRTVEKHVYFAEFYGQTSLKTVYPALVPNAGYFDLQIQDGSTAAAEYRRMLSNRTTETEAIEIAKNLLEYCKRDTLAMVQIFLRLRALTSQKPQSLSPI